MNSDFKTQSCFFNQARNVAEQLAAKLNTRLNYAPVESEEPMEGSVEEGGENTPSSSDVIQKFEEELEINDFPQPVRWKITSRVSLRIRLMTVAFFFISSFIFSGGFGPGKRIFRSWRFCPRNILRTGKEDR